jgi:hypothetical protein
MSKVVSDFKALPLDAQTEAYPQIMAVFNAAKDNRRQQLEAEIRALGFKPGEGKRPLSVAVKYRSLRDPTKTWAGRGAEFVALVSNSLMGIAGAVKKLRLCSTSGDYQRIRRMDYKKPRPSRVTKPKPEPVVLRSWREGLRFDQ